MFARFKTMSLKKAKSSFHGRVAWNAGRAALYAPRGRLIGDFHGVDLVCACDMDNLEALEGDRI
jgi:hypothetical protein